MPAPPFEILPQQKRENPEPTERSNPIPWFLLSLIGALLAFGVVYIIRTAPGAPAEWGDGRTVAELQGKPRAAIDAAADGAAVYAARCSACHQATGRGLPGVFPPLAGSEWVAGKDSMLATIVLHGLVGPITVEGAPYAGAMPAFKDQLQDNEIAAVLTHIRSQWGNTAAEVPTTIVVTVRKDTAARTEPLAGEADLARLK